MTDLAIDALPEAFLAAAGWAEATREPIAGDASARRYFRLRRAEESAILMLSPSSDEVIRFGRVGRWLLERGYSAPMIVAEDAPAGMMLIEDLGDDLIFRLLEADPGREADFYAEITGFLLDLHRHAPPDFLAPLDGGGLADLVRIAPDWYPVLSAGAAAEVPDLIATQFNALDDLPRVLGLRDFHAQNMLWLPARAGVARLGLLDFQDAVATHPAYDLVSALQDVRREVSPRVEARERDRYALARGLAPDRFGAIYALLGAQRALRIQAMFARLCLAGGKPGYLDLMPRNWALLERNLAHPALSELAATVFAAFPAPDPALLNDLRFACATRPML